MFRLAAACDAVKDGVHQILFVTSGRMTNEEIAAFKFIEVLMGREALQYLTVVRTNFAKFDDEDACKADVAKACQIESMAAIFTQVKHVIHVSNPPADQASRSRSAAKMYAYLDTCNEVFMPPSLAAINASIGEFMAAEKALETQAHLLEQQAVETAEKARMLHVQGQQAENEAQRLTAELAQANTQFEESESAMSEMQRQMELMSIQHMQERLAQAQAERADAERQERLCDEMMVSHRRAHEEHMSMLLESQRQTAAAMERAIAQQNQHQGGGLIGKVFHWVGTAIVTPVLGGLGNIVTGAVLNAAQSALTPAPKTAKK